MPATSSAVQAGSTLSGAPLVMSRRSAAVLDDHRHPPALEVEGDLVAPAGSRATAGCSWLQDRLVHGAARARSGTTLFSAASRITASSSSPRDVHVAVDRDLAVGERARLVAAQDVHAAEVLDGGQLLDDDLLPRHAHRPAGQRHRDDHGQQLGREPDRQRHREEERLQQIAPEQRVDEEHEQHQEDDDLQDQEPEPARAALELGLRGRARRGCAATWPNSVAGPVATTTATPSPLTTEVPRKTAVTASPSPPAARAPRRRRASPGAATRR